MSSNDVKGIAPAGEHILFEIHKQERALEERLAASKEDAKKIVAEANVEADKIIKSAKDGRLKKELDAIEAKALAEQKARKEEVVDDKEEVEMIRVAADKNHAKAVEWILSQLLPTV